MNRGVENFEKLAFFPLNKILLKINLCILKA